MSHHTYIRDLGANQYVDGVYAIQNCQLGQTKTGKPYIKCLISDKTGRTPGRMWNTTEELFRQLPTDGFVFIAGQTQPYQGEMQIIMEKVEPHAPTAQELGELLPTTAFDVDKMFAEVLQVLGSLEHPALQALAGTYLADGELMNRFCQAPAAMTLHHAYLGGLLEHTLQLLRLAEASLPHYPSLNRDIVLFGLFIHDLGKCEELLWSQGFAYSDDGNLVGHIARGNLMLERMAQACQDNPEHPVKIPMPILRVLHHIIISHHGELEHGAAKIPATPEAIFIANLDNLDAKMNMAISATRPNTAAGQDKSLGGHFTEKIWALGTKLYRPDPTTVTEPD